MKPNLPLIAVFFFSAFSPLRAQIMPTGLGAKPSPKEKKWKETAEFSFVGTSGNTNTTTLSVKNELQYNWKKMTLDIAAGALGARSKGQTTAERYFANEKLSYKMDERNYLYERAAWEKDRFAGIVNRLDLSVGIGRELIKKSRDKLLGEAGPGYVFENRTTGERKEYPSGRVFGKYTHEFTPTSNFSQSAEYLTNLEDGADFKVNTETAVTAALSAHFSLKLSYSWKHVSKPTPGFGKNDATTSMTLIATY